MNLKIISPFLSFVFVTGIMTAQSPDPYKPDSGTPETIPGMHLVWHDEFNTDGRPDSSVWSYETGFVRNKELQWYQAANAYCKNGLLVIEGRKEKVKSPHYQEGSEDWRLQREYADYTSACIITRGTHQWQYGRFEIRARIDTSVGAWPAIWTLGIKRPWPSNGEIDLMEFYRINGVPTILANTAWGSDKPHTAKWNSIKTPLSGFMQNDPDWPKKFHIWRMDWSRDSITLYLDNRLLNTTLLSETLNADGFNPFQQPHYLLLNLALGANGGEPVTQHLPVRYEVDYVRVYQK